MVHLGCSAEEQKYLQPVNFNFEIQYKEEPLGCSSDNLADATDYVELTDIIKRISQQKKYHLIEHLGYEVFKNIIVLLKAQNLKAQIKLSVAKIKVPVENLKNGVIYSCSHEL